VITPRLDILPAQQRALWPELAAIPKRFVLYGGTAIALRLGHRDSVDFDFFSSGPLRLDGLLADAPWVGDGTVIQQEPEAFACLVERLGFPVKVSFFGGIATGRVGTPDQADGGVLCMASGLDLLGHKLKVILQRAEGRDYQDIAALLEGGLDLADGLAAASALFPRFPVMESVRALGYRADISEPHRVGTDAGQVLDAAIERLPEAIDRLPLLSRCLDDPGHGAMPGAPRRGRR